LSYSTSNNPLPENPGPGNTISGIWRGLIEGARSGFLQHAGRGRRHRANATLSLNGQAIALTQNGRIWRNTDPIELTAGALNDVVITVQKLKDSLAIHWETPARSREVIPARYLYPPDALDVFFDAYTRFVKAASLSVALRMTANEVSQFATGGRVRNRRRRMVERPRRGGKAGSTFLESAAEATRSPFGLRPHQGRDLARRRVAPGDPAMNPAAATTTSESLLFALTRWDQTSLQDVVTHFTGTIADLKRFEFFRRVYDAFELIRLMGIAGGAILDATTK
jgi:hypothetical protein